MDYHCSVEKMNELLIHSDQLFVIHLCNIQMTETNVVEPSSMPPKVEAQPMKAIRKLLLQFADDFSVPD